jgi:hypothetical protein
VREQRHAAARARERVKAMRRYAVDFFSGYLEDVVRHVGSRDVTLVERFLRLGTHTARVLGLPLDMMEGWRDGVQTLLMSPPQRLESLGQAVGFASLLLDAGQRRFRLIFDSPEHAVEELTQIFTLMGHTELVPDLTDSTLAGFRSPACGRDAVRWGYLDVKQVERLLTDLFGDASFKNAYTAAIAGRLSNYARQEAEQRLIEVGIETQNSVSHNIDYLIIGSKGTGGTKHDKVKLLQDKGHKIKVLDEQGLEALLSSPKPSPAVWPAARRDHYEWFVNALRHTWAFELDLYTMSYPYHAEDEY